MSPERALRYQQQDSTQTLAEGMEEYYAQMKNLLSLDHMTSEARALFTRHDTAHVVFGCDTSLRQEVMIDTWILFGSDVGFSTYMAYTRIPEATKILREVGLVRAFWETLVALPALIRIVSQTRRMTKKWPWKDHSSYLHRPLGEIRRELNITLLW